jgi:hypothetical protein
MEWHLSLDDDFGLSIGCPFSAYAPQHCGYFYPGYG